MHVVRRILFLIVGGGAAVSCSGNDSSVPGPLPACSTPCSVAFPEGEVEYTVPYGWPTSTFCNGATRRCEVLTEHCIEGWCYVPAGTFQAGATTFRESGGLAASTPPRHTAVMQRSLWVQQRETTNAEWKQVMGATASPSLLRACGDTCPVADMNIFDVAEFANRLSVRDGLEPCYRHVNCGAPDGDTQAKRKCDAVEFPNPTCRGYRLPTEVEWELAARAGSSGCWPNGEGSFPYAHCHELGETPLVNHGWFCGNSHVEYAGCLDLTQEGGDAGPCMGVRPVATTLPNRLGLYDTAGNVMEMTGRVREPTDFGPTEGSLVIDPGHDAIIIPTDGVRVRGGGFASRAGLTCAYASIAGHAYQVHDVGFVGFRLVRLATTGP